MNIDQQGLWGLLFWVCPKGNSSPYPGPTAKWIRNRAFSPASQGKPPIRSAYGIRMDAFF
ncbi:MAG: hypothetical protein C0407_09965 [Desulfobacca sp.]|nr:hypothetical protein [Desulfobacca sp.]